MTPPSILVVATMPGGAGARHAGGLKRAGFHVVAAAPRGHLLAASAAPAAFHPISHLRPAASLRRALEAAAPDRVLPCDDNAAALLVGLHREERRWSDLVERSIGDPGGYGIAMAKSAQVAHAESLGLDVPRSVVVADHAAFQAELAAGGLPRALKMDGTSGGWGVTLIHRPEQAERAWAGATRRQSLRSALVTALRERSIRPLLARSRWRLEAACLQAVVRGRPANRAVLCDRGRVLAGHSFEVVRTFYPLGPAAVMRPVDHPGMAEAAARMVASLGLSGAHGFDFMLEDGTDRALLIEQNPRATPAHALDPAGDGGLYAAWFAALTGTPRVAAPEAAGEPIGLFPGAWLSAPADPLLRTPRHDVPWDDPALIVAMLAEMETYRAPDRWKARLRRWRGDRR